jgi:hypothetical protein
MHLLTSNATTITKTWGNTDQVEKELIETYLFSLVLVTENCYYAFKVTLRPVQVLNIMQIRKKLPCEATRVKAVD